MVNFVIVSFCDLKINLLYPWETNHPRELQIYLVSIEHATSSSRTFTFSRPSESKGSREIVQQSGFFGLHFYDHI